MYADKFLEFERAGRDAVATTTRALPMGQADFTGVNPPDTSGMGPYGGLWLVVMAAADIAAGYSVAIEHSDTESGTYTALLTSSVTAAAASPGATLFKIPLPFDVRNWVRITKTTADAVNIFLTGDVDKWPSGLIGG